MLFRSMVSGRATITIKVPRRPELIAAIATGDIAYRAPPNIANQICVVILRSQMKIAAKSISGANRNSNEMNNCAFPKVMVPISAITATQVGVALELPKATWCQDSPYNRQS